MLQSITAGSAQLLLFFALASRCCSPRRPRCPPSCCGGFLLFFFLGLISDRYPLTRERLGAYLLFSPESFRITTAIQVVIAIELQNTGELHIAYLSLRFARVALLSFGLDLFAAAFFCALARS